MNCVFCKDGIQKLYVNGKFVGAPCPNCRPKEYDEWSNLPQNRQTDRNPSQSSLLDIDPYDNYGTD